MKACKRTFIAIKITPEKKLLELTDLLKQNLREEGITWANSNNFHLTLRFLGDTGPEQIVEVKQFISETAQHYFKFQFEIQGTGVFEKGGNPHVLFLKINPNENLQKLAADVERRSVLLGFKSSKQNFSPHLTLGRIKFLINNKNFYSQVSQFEDTFIQQVSVSEIILYESILGQGPPVYKPIINTKLK